MGFENVAKNRAFQNTPIMLFLNKKDIFREKIKYSDISAVPCFSDYNGTPGSFDDGVNYFIRKFLDRLGHRSGTEENILSNDTYIYVTCATNTRNMEFVMEAVRTSMIE